MERHGLSDFDWERIRSFFRRRSKRGRPPRDPRSVLEGVLWILATGAPWRDLPRARFGPWQTIYGRFRAWTRTKLLGRILRRLQRTLSARGGLRRDLWCSDSTVIRAGRCAGGARRPSEVRGSEVQALGRSRGGFGTKVSVVCDRRGVPLTVVLGPGQQHDLRQVAHAVTRAIGSVGAPRRLAGDRAYSAAWLRAWLRRRKISPVIPTRIVQKREPRFNREAYRARNVVERLIGWLKESRRVATRYEKLAESYLAFVELAVMRRLLRLLGFSDKA